MTNIPFFLSCFLLLLALITSNASAMTSKSNTTKNKNQHLSCDNNMKFGRFEIPSSHIFCRTKLTGAFVNLRPIVPGHVLVCPYRVVAKMEDLSEDEYLDMWSSVRKVQLILKNHYHATAFNVAVQDGIAAGQSVPHVHVHILPRVEGDFQRNDDVYEELELWAPREDVSKQRTDIEVPEDKDRVNRTSERMAQEAATYRNLLEELSS